jgi:tRNA(Ile)-lysidine synthase
MTRAQTEEICRAAGWSWRVDSTNSSTRWARNRVRHEVVPLLASIGNKSRETLAQQTSRAADIRRDESAYLDELTNTHFQELQLEGKPNSLTLDGARWCELPLALQRRVLHRALSEMSDGTNAVKIRLEQIEEVRRHVMAKKRRKVWSLPYGARLEWTGTMSGNRIRLWHVETKDNMT